MNNETLEYENYRTVKLFRQITALTTYANLWIGEAGYHIKNLQQPTLCANLMEPFFIFVQYPPNNLEHFIYKLSFFHQLPFKIQYDTFNN